MGSSASSPAGGGGPSSSSSSIAAPSSGRNANSSSGALASNSRRRSSGTSNSAAGRTNPTSTSTNSPTHRGSTTATGSTGPAVGTGTGTGITTGSNIISGSPSRVHGPNGNSNAPQVAAGNATTRRRSSGGSPSSGAVTVSGNGSRVVGGVMRPLPSSMSRNRTAGSDFSGGGGGNSNNPTAIPSIRGSAPGGGISAPHLSLSSPYQLSHRSATLTMNPGGTSGRPLDNELTFTPIPDPPSTSSGEGGGGGVGGGSGGTGAGAVASAAAGSVCLNPASEVNSRLDTQVEIKVYPCNNSHGKKKFTQFMVKPEGVIIQGTNRPPSQDIGTEYSRHIGRKLPRYELSDTRASQLLITSHQKSYYVVPAPEAFSRHSGTCRLLGDRKHTPTNHSLKVGDFLRVGSVGVVVIETHNGVRQDVMSEDRIQKIMQDTTVGGYVDMDGETDVDESSDVETAGAFAQKGGRSPRPGSGGMTHEYEVPTCYMCFDETDSDTNPLISPCKCKGDTQFVHVECLRKWHTAEADNLICFLSTVDATCSVCKSSFKSDFKLKSGQLVKLFQSSLEPPYVSLLIATKHEMAQRLFNTRFQLSFHTLLKPDGRNATRPLLLGRSSGSDMVLDYRTVSARHASIKFKNGDFIFSDAGSSNGSYLYVRQPVELSANGPSVQFRLGRSMISMKVVNKWNKRLLRAVVRRSAGGNSSGGSSSNFPSLSFGGGGGADGGNDGAAGSGSGERGRVNARENILKSLPPLGMLSQQSPQHLDLIYALAIPKRDAVASTLKRGLSSGMGNGEEASGQIEQALEQEEEKLEVSEQEDAPAVVESVSQEMTSDDGPVAVDESTDIAPAEEQGEEQNNDVDTELELGSSVPAEEPIVVTSSVEEEEEKQEQDDVEEADDDDNNENNGVEEQQDDAVAADDVSDDRVETTEQDAVGSSDEVDLVMANLSIS